MKNFLIFYIFLTFISCGKDESRFKESPFSFTLNRNNVEILITGNNPIALNSQGITGSKGYYVTSAVERHISSEMVGISFNIPVNAPGGEFLTSEFKNTFKGNKTYNLSTWNEGPSFYYGIEEDSMVVKYTVIEDPLSSFASTLTFTSDLKKEGKTDDNEDTYSIDAIFEMELANEEDASDKIRITKGEVKFWLVDFSSN